MKDDKEEGEGGGEGRMIEYEKKEVITCAGLQPLVLHINTHTHTTEHYYQPQTMPRTGGMVLLP